MRGQKGKREETHVRDMKAGRSRREGEHTILARGNVVLRRFASTWLSRRSGHSYRIQTLRNELLFWLEPESQPRGGGLFPGWPKGYHGVGFFSPSVFTYTHRCCSEVLRTHSPADRSSRSLHGRFGTHSRIQSCSHPWKRSRVSAIPSEPVDWMALLYHIVAPCRLPSMLPSRETDIDSFQPASRTRLS